MTDSLAEKIADTTQTLENRTHYAVLLFRANVLAKHSDLNDQAGAAALKYVLNEEDKSSRDLATRLKARSTALTMGLDRISGEWQYRDSAEKFIAKAERMLQEQVKFHKQQAGVYSLRIVDASPESETYITNRAGAVKEHQASEAYRELTTLFQEAFMPLIGLTDNPATTA